MHRVVLKNVKRQLYTRSHTKTATSEVWNNRVPDGWEVGDVELTVDLEKIARIVGEQALRNRTGRLTGFHGGIKGKVLSRRRIPQA